MKKVIISVICFAAYISSSFAVDGNSKATLWDVFIFLANQYISETPESYQYINLEYSGVVKNSHFEDALQILVYHDLIKNLPARMDEKKLMSVGAFDMLSERILQINISDPTPQEVRDRHLTYNDLFTLWERLEKRKAAKWIKISVGWQGSDLWEKWEIFYDVYNTLQRDFYGKDEVDDDALLNGAIKGLTEGTGDQYTTYFPPIESEDFFDGLDSSNEYEWIWAYVDMLSPGEFIIVTPIVWSPSEKAGLKWGDRITRVDGKNITDTTPTAEIISWIKWPAGTDVTLTIQREGRAGTFEITVTRGNIVIKDVDYSKKWKDIAYIQIRSFGEDVDIQFTSALQEIAADWAIKKIIIDVRNNPGWFLWKVSDVLSHMVPKWETTAIVSYGETEVPYKSLGYEIVDFSNYEVIFLQNGWSASASEIMTGTARDYLPNAKIIWEQSFGKWSVQTLRKYIDGSTRT